MTKRAERTRRILAAQREIDRLAGWDVAEIGRRQREVDDSRRNLVALLETETALSDFFAAALLRRLNTLEARRHALLGERREKEERYIAERTRLRGVEAILETLDEIERKRIEREALQEAIEAAIRRRPSVPGKVEGAS